MYLSLEIDRICCNKVGHLLSDFAIEFASELCCRILLSKVTIVIVVSNVDRIRLPTVDDQP